MANQRDLASRISLVLTPMVAPEDFTPLPDIRPFAQANTRKLKNDFYPSYFFCVGTDIGRIDFDTTPITLDFPVGRTREQSGFVPIINDNINEALEFFMARLGFASEISRPDLVTIGSDVIRLDIVDDDGESVQKIISVHSLDNNLYIIGSKR